VVTVNQSPTANAGLAPVAICQGETSSSLAGSIGGSATSGTWSSSSGGIFIPNATNLNATWTPPANYSGSSTLTLTTGGGLCGIITASKTQLVNPNAVITLTSGPATESQTLCINTPISPISYSISGGATGGGVTGLPTGVNLIFSGGVFTISGTPSITGSFTYTLTTTGTCTQTTTSGTINVNPNASIALTSGIGSNIKTTCVNSSITNITYLISGGGTGAGVTGLPAGVTGAYSGGVFTISGTPSVFGTFNYIITTTGSCAQATANGTITVNPLPTPTLTSSDDDNIICAGTNVIFTAGGGSNYNFFVGSSSKQNGASNTYANSLLTSGQKVSVVVTNTFSCSAASAEITNFVNDLPFILVTTQPTCDANLLTYSLVVTVNSGTVTSTSGTVTNTSLNVWRISNILSGTNITVTVTGLSGCQTDLAVTAPNCSCVPVSAPISEGDKFYCASASIPALTATVSAGETIDWYDLASGGTLLRSGSLSYTPATTGTYYAMARNTTTACVSSTRTAISVSMNPLPTVDVGAPLNAICQGTISSPLAASVGGSATGGIWSSSAAGTFTPNSSNLNATWTPPSGYSGTATLTLTTSGGTCGTTTANKTQAVTPLPTVNSGSVLSAICEGETSVPLSGSFGGSATGATWTTPAGGTFVPDPTVLTSTWTPPTGYFGTAVLTITSSGGTCGTASATRNQVVNPGATITLTTALGTDSQTLCIKTAISSIRYAISGGGTGAGVTGLPAGVNGSYSGSNFTISGTPSVAGTFNYIVTTTGSCSQTTATGTITVNPNAAITLASATGTNAQTLCFNNPIDSIRYLITGGGTGATVSGLPSGIDTVFNGSEFVISGISTETGTFNYIVNTSGSCSQTSANGSIRINLLPIVDVGTPLEDICEGATSIALGGIIGGSATGGNWSTTAGGTFNPNASSLNARWSPPVGYSDTATLILTSIGGTCGTSFDSKTQIVNTMPISNAGFGGNECDTTFALNALPSVGVGVWTMESGSGTAKFLPNESAPDAIVTVSAFGTYSFKWTETITNCSNSSTIAVNFNEQPIANPGTGGTNCGPEITLNALESAGVGYWTQIAGPDTAVFYPGETIPDPLVTIPVYGNYTFQWKETNEVCFDSASIEISFLEIPLADAGQNSSVCGTQLKLNAIPGTGAGTGMWTLRSGPGDALFIPDPYQADASVLVDTVGIYVFAWTEENGTCLSIDSIEGEFLSIPYISAGRDTIICTGETIRLQALGEGSFQWEPSILLDSPTNDNPIASPLSSTYFRVMLTADNACVNIDSMLVELWYKPISFAGPDKVLDYLIITDLEADEPAFNQNGVWSIVQGAGSFIDSSFARTTVNGLSIGQNLLQWTVSNNVCSPTNDTVSIFVNDLVTTTLITPNGDNKNDFLEFVGIETLGKTELVIFDRRGLQVFKNSNYNNNWNGIDYNGNPLPDDTYFYILSSENGKTISKFIVIRR
jgi:gliding motility-associated-like protein